MKKIIISLLIFTIIFIISGCKENANTNTTENKNDTTTDGPILLENSTSEQGTWEFYNERAEAFVKNMANGYFDEAFNMCDTTVKQAMPAASLQKDVWENIVAKAGKFIDIDKIDNQTYKQYHICFVTSKHENSGVTLRVVFSENGLISGLLIDSFTTIPTETVKREGFTDYPVIIGESTDYPLNGILSIPDNATGKVPAVVLVQGSGPSDLDETIYENKPFRDIADYLASNGIAVIRYNKRTYTYGLKMTQELGGSLTVEEEIIQDAILATKILKSDSRIDENKVFILGHSLGAMLAPRIDAEGGDYAGLILLAGSPRSLLLDILYDQQMASVEDMPEGSDKISALSKMENYDEQAQALINLPDDEAKKTAMSGAAAYYYKEMDKYPVSEYIQNITAPFLILQGSKDVQVSVDKDFEAYKELFDGRTNATFKLYEGLNHLFMPSTGANITNIMDEYKIPSHVDNQVLKDIADWIKSN